MTAGKGGKKQRAAEPIPHSDTAVTPGPGVLQKPDSVYRRHAHIDDLIRVIRNLAALILAFSVTTVLIAYAGIRMGVSPEICWTGSVGSGPVLVRAFIKVFETVRPVLPDAPKDPPSSAEP